MVYIPVDIEKAIIRECSRRRLSKRTAKTYLYCINRFLLFVKKDLGHISKRNVRLFLEYLSDKNLSGSTLNVYHMAIRFLFIDILDKRMWIDIKYSKITKKLPIVLTKDEVKKLFNSIDNPKHKLMVELMYSSGLRVSELLGLRVCNLEIEKGYGFVRKGKGNKDRLFILSQKIVDKIIDLIDFEKLSYENYLFNSNRNSKYNVRSLQNIIKCTCREADIKKRVSCHTLRHSFATHLIEKGYDVSQVQSLLGHKSPETTMIYVHISSPNMINVKSPFDDL